MRHLYILALAALVLALWCGWAVAGPWHFGDPDIYEGVKVKGSSSTNLMDESPDSPTIWDLLIGGWVPQELDLSKKTEAERVPAQLPARNCR
jgi:hypothetical protein